MPTYRVYSLLFFGALSIFTLVGVAIALLESRTKGLSLKKAKKPAIQTGMTMFIGVLMMRVIPIWVPKATTVLFLISLLIAIQIAIRTVEIAQSNENED